MQNIGSIPRVKAFELSNSSKRPAIAWGFVCPYCRVIHTHKVGEGFRSNVCTTDQGRAAYRFGYYLELSDY